MRNSVRSLITGDLKLSYWEASLRCTYASTARSAAVTTASIRATDPVRWFAELTNRKLRRSAHRSVTELEADIRCRINQWNADPSPSGMAQDPRRHPRHPSPHTASDLGH